MKCSIVRRWPQVIHNTFKPPCGTEIQSFLATVGWFLTGQKKTRNEECFNSIFNFLNTSFHPVVCKQEPKGDLINNEGLVSAKEEGTVPENAEQPK